MTKPVSKTIELQSGRVVSFFDFGDPIGDPILLHTGHMSSGILSAFIDDLARKNGFRVISINRPGIGESDFYDFDLVSVADDSKQLMTALKLGKYIVVSLSAGVAFMFAICQENESVLLGVGLGVFGPFQKIEKEVTGLEKIYFNTKGVIIPSLFLSVFKFCPWLIDLIANSMLDGLPQMENRETMKEILRWDRKLALLKGMKPMIVEKNLLTLDWSELVKSANKNIKYLFFHGQLDKSAPTSVLEWYKSILPKSNFVLYKNENHFAPLNHLQEIFMAMRKEI